MLNKMKKPAVVKVNMISVLKACGNTVISQLPRMASPLPLPPQSQLTPKPITMVGYTATDPCLDLYYHHATGTDPLSTADFHRSLKQLLPAAWAHKPLTTLKLICNLARGEQHHDGGMDDQRAFFTAAIWLHQNHPKTLAANLVPIFSAFGHIPDLTDLLSAVLRGKAGLLERRDAKLKPHRVMKANAKAAEKSRQKASALLRRRNSIHAAHMAAERYVRDPDYRFLHDQVSDVFAECLKSDIEKLQHHLQHYKDEDEDQDDYFLEITYAAKYCPTINSAVRRLTDLLCESIAKKVFQSEPSGDCCIARLKKKILVPLKRALAPSIRNYNQSGLSMNRWGFSPMFKQEAPAGFLYLKKVKEVYLKQGEWKIDPAALLPHEILRFARMESVFPGISFLAELQWKKMVEEVYLKRGKLKNWLAVCDVAEQMTQLPDPEFRATLALGVLVSELGEGPWKGKVVNYSRNPRLHSVQGEHLLSRCKFLGTLSPIDWTADFGKVFDLILEVAVNEKLKPEQMVKKVLVLTCWKPTFKDICWGKTRAKFEDKGYGDVVPHLVIWNMIRPTYVPGRMQEPGVTLLSGFSPELLKLLLENDGEIGPAHVMEAAISAPVYQNLVVVD